MWVIFVPDLGYYAGEYAKPQFVMPYPTGGYASPQEAERDLIKLKVKFKSALVLSPGQVFYKNLHPNWLPREGELW